MTTTASAQRRHGALPLKVGRSPFPSWISPRRVPPALATGGRPAPAMMQVADATGIMAGEADEWTRCREQARDAFLGSLRQDVANLHAILQSRQALLHAQATGAHPAGWARAAVGTSEPALVEGTDQDALAPAPRTADLGRRRVDPHRTAGARKRVSPADAGSLHGARVARCPTGPGAAGSWDEGPRSPDRCSASIGRGGPPDIGRTSKPDW